MKAFWKALAHAALGGAAAGLATYSGGPITVKTALYPALASAFTSILSLFSAKPGTEPTTQQG